MFMTVFSINAMADAIVDEEEILTVENNSNSEMIVNDESADAVANYDMTGSVFQQITDLEQEKMLMKLEKERAELDLDLDRLAAEKVKLRMELDELSNRGDKELEQKKLELEQQAAKLEDEKKKIAEKATPEKIEKTETDMEFSKKYKLIDIIGAGTQLQSTVQDLSTGQRKKISVGKMLDDYSVMSISLYDGVVFEKDNKKETLHIGTSAE